MSLFTTRDFFTVIVFVATIFVEFPLKSNTVADIVAVPALIPFTFPASSTVAFVVSLEVHLTLLFSISVGFIVLFTKMLNPSSTLESPDKVISPTIIFIVAVFPFNELVAVAVMVPGV